MKGLLFLLIIGLIVFAGCTSQPLGKGSEIVGEPAAGTDYGSVESGVEITFPDPGVPFACLGDQHVCTAGTNKWCCPKNWNCGTTAGECKNICPPAPGPGPPGPDPTVPKTCPDGSVVCCPQGLDCKLDPSSGKNACIGPCTDPKPVYCPTKDGPMCCDTDTFCVIDSSGKLSCGGKGGCPNADDYACGFSSTGAQVCCTKNDTCAKKKNGSAICCGLGTYYSPTLDQCVGAEETVCKATPSYICPGGAGQVCCTDTKSCCPKGSECCFGVCCDTATSKCDKDAKICVKKTTMTETTA